MRRHNRLTVLEWIAALGPLARSGRAVRAVVSEKTVAKVMRLEDIRGKRKRRYKVTIDSRDTKRIADNLLDRRFSVEEPNRACVSDVTAIWTHAGWGYLAAILDLFSRRVVGMGHQ